MALLDSLLDAIIRLSGDALVMHVGEKPYVVTTSSTMNAFRGPLAWGQVELSSRPLTPEAVIGMLAQILPDEQRQMLDYLGAVEHELPAPDGGQPFLLTAARGGDDIWVEVRRKPHVEELLVSPAESEVQPSEQPSSEPSIVEPPAAIPEPEPLPAVAELTATVVSAECDIPAAVVEEAVTAILEDAIPEAQAQGPADSFPELAAEVVAQDSDLDAVADEPRLETVAQDDEEVHIDLTAALGEEEAPEADRDTLTRLSSFDTSITESRAIAEEVETEPAVATLREAEPPVLVVAATPQTGVRPGSDEGQTRVRPGSDPPSPDGLLRADEGQAPLGSFVGPSADVVEAAAVPVAQPSASPELLPAAAVDQPEVFEAEAILATHQEQPQAAEPVGVEAQQSGEPVAAEAHQSVAAVPEPQVASPEPLAVEPAATALNPPIDAQQAEPVQPVASVTEPEPVGLAAEPQAPAAVAAETQPAPGVAAVPEPLPVEVEQVAPQPVQPAAAAPDRQVAVQQPHPVEPVAVSPEPQVAAPEPQPVQPIAALAEAQIAASEAPFAAAEPEPVQPVVAAPQPEPVSHAAAAPEPQQVAASPPQPVQPVVSPEPQQPAAVAPERAQPALSDVTPAPTSEPAPTVIPIAKPSLKLQPPPAPAVSVPAASTEASLVALLKAAASRGASTLYAVADARPMIRVAGAIALLGTEAPVSGAEVDRFTFEFAPREQVAERTPEWTCAVKGVGRVRCVTFHDDSGTGLIFHLPSPDVSTADELGLDARIQVLCEEADGLVVIAAPRNNGKSTLLDAFVDLINRTRYDHVITIESQIRTAHEKRHSFISQRLSNPDGEAIAAAARSALREGPDVLVIEDLRAPEALSVALDAARAGRLVFGGIAAPTAAAAVERLVGPFPADRRPQVRALLATSLRAVVAQVLVRKPTGGRIGARELLLNSPAVEKLILDGSFSQLPLAIEGGRRLGMVTMNDALGALVRDGVVTVAEAVRAAADRASLVAALERDGIDVSGVERRA